ncbi:unnamed protein product [Mytilus coruscus]|uniref:Uncharacterized protein n=1 Tax=Mytilus coruscus TaxID=42192 RepID=A0A6J8D300_MYTCO|nr:unnamed protein product [Mytilus coruscus]
MAFSVGYSSIQKLNIRNLYSAYDLPANEIMCRKMETTVSTQGKYSLIHSCTTINDTKDEKTDTKSSVFRSVSYNKATEIVNRLCLPRVFPEERNSKKRNIERKEDVSSLQKKRESESNNVMKTESSFKEQRKHVKRVSHPTVSSSIRHKLYRGRNDHLSEIIKSCERSVLQPSQRYYPLAYRNWLKVENLRGIKTDFKDYNYFSK